MSERRTVTASEPTIRRMASKLPSAETTIVTKRERGSGGMNWMSTCPAAGLLTGSASCHGIGSALATRRRQRGEPLANLPVLLPERRQRRLQIGDLPCGGRLALGGLAVEGLGRPTPIFSRLLADRPERLQIPLRLGQRA